MERYVYLALEDLGRDVSRGAARGLHLHVRFRTNDLRQAKVSDFDVRILVRRGQ